MVYLCDIQCLKYEFYKKVWWGVLDTALCGQVWNWRNNGQWLHMILSFPQPISKIKMWKVYRQWGT